MEKTNLGRRKVTKSLILKLLEEGFEGAKKPSTLWFLTHRIVARAAEKGGVLNILVYQGPSRKLCKRALREAVREAILRAKSTFRRTAPSIEGTTLEIPCNSSSSQRRPSSAAVLGRGTQGEVFSRGLCDSNSCTIRISAKRRKSHFLKDLLSISSGKSPV